MHEWTNINDLDHVALRTILLKTSDTRPAFLGKIKQKPGQRDKKKGNCHSGISDPVH